MPDLISGRKVASVRLEGTITTKRDLPFDLGDPKPGAITRLQALQQQGYRIVIVTGLTATQNGTRIAFKYLADNGIPYDDVFCTFGTPAAEKVIDDNAEPLFPKESHG